MDKKVNFRAVHTRQAWREAHHSSIERALRGPKRGALALFRGTNDHTHSKDYGDPLYAFVWTENEGYAVRPDPSADMQVVKVPVSLLLEFDSAKEVNEEKLAPYFNAQVTAPAGAGSACLSDDAYQPNWWWVNHKQTFRAELDGGYIWSPKQKANGASNPTYDNLTQVKAGDFIISYANGLIKAIGVATGGHVEKTKPAAFGAAGEAWSDLGWMVHVDWIFLSSGISPKANIEVIRALLPSKHSPLQASGNGNQGCYLAEISSELGWLIKRLAQAESENDVGMLEVLSAAASDGAIEDSILHDSDIPETEKVQVVRARRGQGIFRERALSIEPRCRLTGVDDHRFLVASHIKPWRACTNAERLDGNNGLMLSPHVDLLFDQGWVSFQDDGRLIVAEEACSVLAAWGHITPNTVVKPFTPEQAHYLSYHRQHIFRRD